MFVGEMESEAPTPDPDSATVCGDPETLSENEMAAVCGPIELGVNVTLMLHSALTAMVPPFTGQFVPGPNANSDAFVPVSEIVLICSVRLPVFPSVTVCGPLVVPTICAGNVSDVGARFAAADGGTPTPESGTV